VERLHARAALAVAVEAAHLERQAREARHHAEARELAPAAHVAEARVLDHRVLHLRVAVEQGAHDLATGVVEARGDELALGAAGERGAGSIDQDDVAKGHGGTSGGREERHSNGY
jgi:hypothetical protein